MFKDDNQLDDFFGLKPESHEKISNLQKLPLKKRGVKEIILSIPQLLSKKERYLILAFLLVIIGSAVATPISAFFHFTRSAPDYGGSFTEGVIGEPRYINPLLSRTNDTDRDLVSLIYSGLMKYNEEGKLVPDLVKSYEVSNDGLNYTIYLKDNARWHDGTKVTADDVIFTIQIAQNRDYGSPEMINWSGVEMERIGEYSLIFKLKNKYAQFLNNFTIKILPKHIWQDIKPINFAFSEYNLKPIGSGPYKFSKFKKDKNGRIASYELESNKNYYGGKPYIDNIEFRFFNSEDELIENYNSNNLDSMSSVSPKNLKKIKFKQRLNIHELKIPRYFAIFFNQNQSKKLSDKNIRLALNYGTDKKELVQRVLGNNGIVAEAPLSEGLFEVNNAKEYEYNPDKAKQLLPASVASGSEKINLKLSTSSWPELTEVATILKEQWAKIGIELDIEVMQTPELQQVIKDRSYEMLLFGEVLPPDPDPYNLWHSSQKRDPGLNLALYDNKSVDTLLDEARQTLNPNERIKKYEEFQKLLAEDAPAVFLYNPYYLYPQGKQIKGSDMKIISMPSDRFANVNNWYIETKRTWK